MPGTQKFAAVDIKGFSPGVDPTASDSIFALSGKNYIFDSLGPKSAFGDRYLLPQPRSKPQYSQGYRIHTDLADRTFYMDGDGIWEWLENLGGYQLIYATVDTTLLPSRWTWGFLADVIYFCHPDTGILCLDIESDVCLPHISVGIATPDNALAIAVNNGHLCCMTPIFFAWSNPSDGLDFTPALGGGGFQLLTDLVSGTPVMLTSYSTGCLTWTTGGVLRSEFTGDSAVFQHRALSTDYRPVNSFCVVRIDDNSVVVLDERGLFLSNGSAWSPYTKSMTPYAPLFNEFLIEYIRTNKLDLSQNVRLEWDELTQHLYLSVKFTYNGALYTQCFVYYPAIDKWGEFNEPHYGIIPVGITKSERSGNYYGYVDSNGCIKYWPIANSRESVPTVEDYGDANLWYPAIEKPVQFNQLDPGRIASGSCRINGFPVNATAHRAGFYTTGIAEPLPPVVESLNSELVFGLFRPTGPSASDELSEVVNVLIRSEQNLIDLPEVEDYMLESGSEDFELEPDQVVDYGDNMTPITDMTLQVISTVDGVTSFMETSPCLVVATEAARYYSCSSVGAWHKLKVSTENIGDSFHIKTGEITAASAGRLL